MNNREYKRKTSKGDMIKIMKWQRHKLREYEKMIENLEHVIYMRDLMYNPCHESERLT